MDGARLFNAAIALNVDPAELTQYVDSVTFCLSKGLSAPVGSILCGSYDFIRLARRVRKSVGGGMRQAGILAAAGIVSLERMVDRLADDHKNARRLAEGLNALNGIEIDLDMVKTNMVVFNLADDIALSAQEITRRMRETANVWLGARGQRGFRAVTHYWIGEDDVDVFLNVLEESLQR